MKPIWFTNHAREKLSLSQRQGFSVDQETVEQIIRESTEKTPRYLGRLIAQANLQANLDEEHVLRVIYEEFDEIAVVTL